MIVCVQTSSFVVHLIKPDHWSESELDIFLSFGSLSSAKLQLHSLSLASSLASFNKGAEMWWRHWRQNCNDLSLSPSCSLRRKERERESEEREIVRWQAIHHHPSCKNCQYHSFVVVSFACIKEWVKMGGSGPEIFQNNIFSRGSFLPQTVDAGWRTGKPSDRSQIGRKHSQRTASVQFFTKS